MPLRYKYKEGEKWLEVAKLTAVTTSDDETYGNMLKSDLTKEITYLNETKSVEKDGSALIDVTIKKVKFSVTQSGMTFDYDSETDTGKSTNPIIQAMAQFKGLKFQVKVSDMGKVLETKGGGGENIVEPDLAEVLRVVFPKEPVKKGDKWTNEGAHVKINSTLESLDGNTAIIKSEVTSIVKSDGESSEPNDRKLTGGSCTFHFDAKEGKPVKTVSHVSYELTVGPPMLPKEIKMNMKSGIEQEFKPAGAMDEKKEDKKEKEDF
ncbi:hypothetical protein HY605_05575 [Candidatus Peregrinibacteria bacterium]|nr:hypothetical protein [Candidatus Peregrinibacteria bacterium]